MNKKYTTDELIDEKAIAFNKGMSRGIYLARKQIMDDLEIQVKKYQKENNYFQHEKELEKEE